MEIDHSLDGDSRFGEICAILSVGCAVSFIVVSLRSYTRLFLLHSFGLDDGVMLVTLLLSFGTAVAIGLESKFGLGSHTWEQPVEHFVPYMKSFYASIVVYNVGMCLVKISILLQYRRIFSGRTMQTATLCGVLFLSAWAVTLSFLLTLVCIPVAKFWIPGLPGKCLDFLTIWYIMASFNLTTDLIIFVMPLPVIRSLQLPRRQKIMLFAVFGLGFFTCIITIVRIRTLRQAAETSDPNWNNVDAATWSFLELTIAIVAACLPTLRPIFVKLVPRLFNSTLGRSHVNTGYGSSPYAPGTIGSMTPSNAKLKKSALARSDSTRSLQEEESIELGSHDSAVLSPAVVYSVQVTGGHQHQHQHQRSTGWDSGDQGSRKFGPQEETEQVGAADGGFGIQTTTVITQQVSFR
ncbi:hypothetical protein F5X68DRAFT_246505 [Plectosphaerella plurivora]|uniref:Rhodopsin domain-containing protein n=1 Tax=Plectosphaerella plurivora TaxID=936078 RepID=A0A9P9A6W6_9PEZI|nr:hypothetical protein F5X68DRAFT_246505 [Plectosphaerella plurivora]